MQYEPGHLGDPDRFYFDLRDTQLSPGLEGKSYDGDTLLNRIRIAQPAANDARSTRGKVGSSAIRGRR